MNLADRFKRNVEDQDLFSTRDRLILAVSGGADSVVLCELCKQAGFDFIIAHCNFQLRGAESERDEQFVKELAAGYGAEFFVKRFDTLVHAEREKQSVQVAARGLRYQWFASLAEGSTGISGRTAWILTAHHLDDNIETSLMNFFKGTGITGLRGMLPKQGQLIRPLLFAKKEELLSFARQHHLAWVEDSSNSNNKYTRNYFRNEVLPLIEKVYPQAADNLADNLPRFRDAELLYLQAIGLHKKKLLEIKGNEVHIPVLKLRRTVPLQGVLYEIIKEYSFSPNQVTEVLGLMESESGKYIQSATHRIIRNRAWLIIAPVETEKAQTILIEGEGVWPFPGGSLHLRQVAEGGQLLHPDGDAVAALDPGSLQFPLLLRRWKQGDYFYPLGMKKKKKVARFLIDRKVSKTEKERVWVLEMDKKILWVVGMRIDERFKVKDETLGKMQIEFRLR